MSSMGNGGLPSELSSEPIDFPEGDATRGVASQQRAAFSGKLVA